MRCLAVCQDELVIRMLDEVLLSSFEIEFLVENKALARRLNDAGVHIRAGDPRKTDTFVKADITPETCIILEDNGRRSLRRTLDAIHDAGGALIYVLGIGIGTTPNGKRKSRPPSRMCRTSRWRSCSAVRSGPSSAVR